LSQQINPSPNSATPFYKIKLARRQVQLVALVVSIPLCIALIIIGRWDILIGILVLAIISSVFIGRAFCSWVCPLGTIYELSRLGFSHKLLRPLCRIGCPFSLIIGFMNRFSLLKVRIDEKKCNRCGLCDTSCPVGLPDRGMSYENFATNPSRRYACIRCLNCVASCPAGALTFGLRKPRSS